MAVSIGPITGILDPLFRGMQHPLLFFNRSTTTDWRGALYAIW